jgi:hypothetical protein
MDLHKEIEGLADELLDVSTTSSGSIDPLIIERRLRILLARRSFASGAWQAKYERRLDFWNEQKSEMIRGQFAFATNAMRSLILINGVAAISMLTFLGNLIATEPAFVDAAARALLYFAFGVAVAALVAMGSYVVQYIYNTATNPEPRMGIALHYVSVIMAILSLICFISGVYVCYDAMKSL